MTKFHAKDTRLKHAAIRGICSAACGFLLSSGAVSGALFARWSMTALVGGIEARLCGLVLFGTGCAAVWLIKTEYGETAASAVDWAILSVYALWRMYSMDSILALAADCAAVLAMLAVCRRSRIGWNHALLLLVVLLLKPALPQEMAEHQIVRMDALCSGLASAGLCGSGTAGLAEQGQEIRWPYFISGLAAGIVW